MSLTTSPFPPISVTRAGVMGSTLSIFRRRSWRMA